MGHLFAFKFASCTSALRKNPSSVTLLATAMNPDKLFDYLDGKLPDGERRRIEQQLVSDTQLQRELSMAREIHSRMRGDSREVVVPEAIDAERGRKLARRIGIAFIVLMAVNVGAGLWIIARKEMANPNRKLLEDQMRDQISKSLDRAASALTPPPLGVTELTITVGQGQLDTAADKVVTAAEQLGGSATKQLPDSHRIGVLVELPANRDMEFRRAIDAVSGKIRDYPASGETKEGSEKKSFIVHILEPATPQN